MRRIVVVGCLCANLGCLDPLEAKLDAYRMDPLPVYRTLWDEVQQCSGLHGDFDRVRWFAVPQTPFRCGAPGGYCRGAWLLPHNVYLAQRMVDDSSSRYFTVRHEMLHDLIGRPGHPPVFDTCYLRIPEQEPPDGYYPPRINP